MSGEIENYKYIEDEDLYNFYNTESMSELVVIQAKHIKRLQRKFDEYVLKHSVYRKPREG